MNWNWLNLNTLQTVLTGAMVVAFALLKFTGCTELASGELECTKSWLATYVSPATLLWIVGALGFIKLTVIPWFQDGGFLRNLFAPKVPVTTGIEKGTVTPTQVAK